MMNYSNNLDIFLRTEPKPFQTFVAPVDGTFDVFGLFGLLCSKGEVYTYDSLSKVYRKGNNIFARYLTCNILVVDEHFAQYHNIRYNNELLEKNKIEIIYKTTIK